jgi:hypothetical protein
MLEHGVDIRPVTQRFHYRMLFSRIMGVRDGVLEGSVGSLRPTHSQFVVITAAGPIPGHYTKIVDLTVVDEVLDIIVTNVSRNSWHNTIIRGSTIRNRGGEKLFQRRPESRT